MVAFLCNLASGLAIIVAMCLAALFLGGMPDDPY